MKVAVRDGKTALLAAFLVTLGGACGDTVKQVIAPAAERPATCGDGVVEPSEDCEGGVPFGTTCQDLGCSGGTLGCDEETCRFDLAQCQEPCTCPLAPGQYAITTIEGAKLTVSTFAPFPFPTGGVTLLDVPAAEFPECRHEVVVPDGGFTVPVFCVPNLGFTVRVGQVGCGVGVVDSNGGADFTVDEKGDSSDKAECDPAKFSQRCAVGQDSNIRVDVTIGDGVTDTCTQGRGNIFVSIPVATTTWLEQDSGPSCPANDEEFDGVCINGTPNEGATCGTDMDCGNDPPGVGDCGTGGDILIVVFPQNLDFTTDTNSADFADLDGDGCCLAGAGPASPPCGTPAGLTNTGVCLDLEHGTVTRAASGPIGSNGAPLYDLTFTDFLPETFEPTGQPFAGETCPNPPKLPPLDELGVTQAKAIRCLEAIGSR